MPSFIYDKTKKAVVSAEEFHASQRNPKRSSLPSPMVMKDIVPFFNVAVDGKEISSRSHKRQMMKEHGLEEVGNEKPKVRKLIKPRNVRQSIQRTMQELGVK